jgi:hypothetical protein
MVEVAIDSFSVSGIVLAMECHDSMNPRAWQTTDQGNMVGVEMKYDISVGVRVGVAWIVILVIGINSPMAIAR